MYLLPVSVFISFYSWVRIDLMKLIRRVVLVAVKRVLGRKGG